MTLTSDQIDVHIGHRIRDRRKSMGISQGQLSNHLGLTFSQVQKYERGFSQVGAGRLLLIADFLEVPFQHFFDGLACSLPRGPSGRRERKQSMDFAALNEAFVSIPNPDIRQLLLALACALAKPPR